MDMNEEHWTTPCPKIDCRKNSCKRGLHFVSIPAALESDTPPENGRYCNTIVKYEGSGAVYIYSAEGIPVLVKEGNAS